MQSIVIAFDGYMELNCKTLLLKAPHSLVTEHGELSLWDQASLVVKVPMQAAEKQKPSTSVKQLCTLWNKLSYPKIYDYPKKYMTIFVQQ